MKSNNVVLVLAAHPDDEVLGCGGTIARLVQEGRSVYIAILGEGISSRYDKRDNVDKSAIVSLHKNSRGVAKLLGAKEPFLFNLPDNRFDSVDLLDIVKIIEHVLESVNPATVYTQHGGDLNNDHTLTYRATLIATRPLPGSPVKRVFAYEVASSSEWSFRKFNPEFRPNVFTDITETLDVKIKAMKLYNSEIRKTPHPRSEQALVAAAKHRGSMVGLQAAEAFELVREIQ